MIVDTNAWLSRYPFRRLAGDEPADLVARLRKHGVGQAWVASFDALLHRDIAGVNARLAADCKAHGAGFLIPFGTVNPKSPDWREDLRRCREQHRMPGIRLHPNYHGYTLADPDFAELLREAARLSLVVQLAAGIEDERTQHPLLRVPVVDLAPLLDALRSAPNLRLVILNQKRDPRSKQLAQAGQVYFDIAMVEGVAGVAALAGDVSASRVIFGSHFPFFVFESALFKVRESGLPASEIKAIEEDNARRLLTI